MTFEEFNNLSYDEKLFAIVDKGNFFNNYVLKNIRINLYSIEKFYIELIYDPISNKVSEIKSFRYGEDLDKYFEKINLN